LPEGDYLVRLTQVDEKKTKNGDAMLSARYQVVKGDFKDRLIFENYLIEHDNAKVVDISMRKLKELARATGDETEYEAIGDIVANIGEFAEIPVTATVGIREPFTNSKGETKVDNKIMKLTGR
jgi:Protein of unknown function (DUF669)